MNQQWKAETLYNFGRKFVHMHLLHIALFPYLFSHSSQTRINLLSMLLLALCYRPCYWKVALALDTCLHRCRTFSLYWFIRPPDVSWEGHKFYN